MESEEFLNVARFATTSLLLVDSRGLITELNAAACEALQQPKRVLVGSYLYEHLIENEATVRNYLQLAGDASDLSSAQFRVKQAGDADVAFLFEGGRTHARAEREEPFLVLRFRPLDTSKKVHDLDPKIAETEREITILRAGADEQARLLAAEKSARMSAEKANRSRDEFLAVVAHELRAPLNVFKGWIDLLVLGQVDKGEYQTVLLTLQRNCHHQIRLIDDLLDVSSVITRKVKLNLQPTDIPALIANVTEGIKATADAKNVDVFVAMGQGDGLVAADSDRIRQVLWNLLANALKFSPKGSKVFVSLKHHDSYLQVRVIDEGEGIEREVLPYVFERFQQDDSSKRSFHGGLGLGLAVVRHIVEMHGGSVAAASGGKGKGTTITMKLPLMAEKPQENLVPISSIRGLREKPEQAPAQTGTPYKVLPQSRPLEGLRILVVDDELDARTMIARILQRYGAEVVTACSARGALATFSESRFDVLVSDIGMPDVNGYELIREIRCLDADAGRTTPAAAITGFASASDRLQALKAGFNEHLAKPVDVQALIGVTTRLVGRTR